jgi:hypothetical protein
VRPFTPGSRLLEHQDQPVTDLLARVRGFGYDPIALDEHLDELVDLLAPACRDEEDCWPIVHELAEWVQWKRAPAYCVAYVFQTLTNRMSAPAHGPAALIFADAQTNLADDMAFFSTEAAWLFMEGALAAAPDREALEPARLHVVSLLREFHRYYARWTRPYGYTDVNPLLDTLYTRRVWHNLAARYPEHTDGIALDSPAEEKAAALRLVAVDAEADEDTYYWLTARRLAAVERQSSGDLATAESETAAVLRDARDFGLEAEIGHLLRTHAWQLMLLGDLGGAEQRLEEALRHEQPVTLFGYWYALSARELGNVRMSMVSDEEDDPATAMDHALEAYYEGRRVLDVELELGGPAAGAASKRQMVRSYTDNAINLATVRGYPSFVLAELETSGPRALSAALAETRALDRLEGAEADRFLAARKVFRRHLTSVPSSFEDYLADLPADLDLRRQYVVTRNTMRLRPGRSGSDEVVSRILDHLGTDLLVVAFYISAHHTSRAVLLDLATGGADDLFLGEVDQPLRAAYGDYVSALAIAAEVPGYPPLAARKALDEFLAVVETLLRPVLTMLSGYGRGRPLVVVPQMHLNAVPFAALRVEGEHLVDVVPSISVVPSVGLLADLLEDGRSFGGSGLVALHETGGTPFFSGTLRHLAGHRSVSTSDNPTRPQALSALAGAGPDLFLACHGRFDNDDPAASSLRVAPGVELSLSDLWAGVAGSDLRSVVLGACESGLARAEIGSEHIGWAGALLSAGVRSVVGSLWKVNQLATAVLLADCLADAADMPVALAAAQRALRATERDDLSHWIATHLPELARPIAPMIDSMADRPFAHPDDWAGFFAAGL